MYDVQVKVQCIGRPRIYVIQSAFSHSAASGQYAVPSTKNRGNSPRKSRFLFSIFLLIQTSNLYIFFAKSGSYIHY